MDVPGGARRDARVDALATADSMPETGGWEKDHQGPLVFLIESAPEWLQEKMGGMVGVQSGLAGYTSCPIVKIALGSTYTLQDLTKSLPASVPRKLTIAFKSDTSILATYM